MGHADDGVAGELLGAVLGILAAVIEFGGDGEAVGPGVVEAENELLERPPDLGAGVRQLAADAGSNEISVLRVGGSAQIKAMRQVAGKLRLDLAQYREMAAFAQFGSDLDKATQQQLARGQRMVELLKQGQYAPLPVEKQVAAIFAGSQGLLDDLPVDAVRPFEEFFHGFLERRQSQILSELRDKREISDALRETLTKAVTDAKAEFAAAKGIKAA